MNKSDLSRNNFMLKGALANKGYDWWWHNFTGYHRVTGEKKAFFIEYFICNPGLGSNQAILGQLPENREKGRKPSYALIKAGCWGKDAKQIHNFYPISSFYSGEGALDIKIGDCTLTEKYMKGRCLVSAEDAAGHPEYMCDPGSMSWNLSIDKKIAYNVGYGASKLLRRLNVFEMFWHAEGIKTEYGGEVLFDGELYDIIPESSFGYADKNWGADFTSPWLWISSCDMKSTVTGEVLTNSAVEIGGGRPKIFGVPLNRKLLGGLFYEGKMFDYNFSKFWTGAKMDFSFKEDETVNTWTVNAENRSSVMSLVLKCSREEMLLINYEAPNGKKLHNKLWNGGTGYGIIKLYKKEKGGITMIDEIQMENAGCEYGEYDVN